MVPKDKAHRVLVAGGGIDPGERGLSYVVRGADRGGEGFGLDVVVVVYRPDVLDQGAAVRLKSSIGAPGWSELAASTAFRASARMQFAIAA